jgi:TusA-related sulfurtransferase
MSEEVASPRRLDVTGLRCPLPILMTARELRDRPAGTVLEVVGDDPGILEDMPVWCEDTGNRLLELRQADGLVHCRVEKAALSTPAD